MAVSVVWHLEIRSVLTGPGTDFGVDRSNDRRVELSPPPTKTADTPYAHADGSFRGEDHDADAVLAYPYVIRKASQALAWNSYVTLRTAWAKSTTDITIDLMLPGEGHVQLTGRPRNPETDLSEITFGVVRFLGVFHYTPPYTIVP